MDSYLTSCLNLVNARVAEFDTGTSLRQRNSLGDRCRLELDRLTIVATGVSLPFELNVIPLHKLEGALIVW